MRYLVLLALILLLGCVQEQESLTRKTITSTVNPVRATLDFINTSNGSNQYDFEGASNSLSSVDVSLYGVLFNNLYDLFLEGNLTFMGNYLINNDAWSEAGDCNVSTNNSSIKPVKGGVYCLTTSEGNTVKFIITSMERRGNASLTIYWVIRSGDSFINDSITPSITHTSINGDEIIINLSEPIDYEKSWSELINPVRHSLMIKCGDDVFYGALQQPGPYDALIYRIMSLPNEDCTAYFSGVVTDFNGNTVILNKTWSLS